MAKAKEKKPEEQWGIVELMGHVRIGGKVSEEQKFGVVMGRIDIPQKDGKFVTQYFGGSSIYRFHPSTEEAARAVLFPPVVNRQLILGLPDHAEDLDEFCEDDSGEPF
jgi:hypothetical protein